jgi:hypothetical protein
MAVATGARGRRCERAERNAGAESRDDGLLWLGDDLRDESDVSSATLLTSEAKEALRKTVRGLRAHLLEQLTEAVKGEYRLDVAAAKAKLPEARRCRRERLELWIDEQIRSAGKTKADSARFLRDAVKEAAHTLVNRLVLVRILEHHGLIDPAVVTRGWSSAAYEQEFAHYAGPLAQDDTRGYRDLLGVVFAELALELPGLFGPVGLTPLFPVPAGTLREVVTALNEPALDSAWGDDTTLGWIYQYWNDPEREALDAKIAGGGKIEPNEIASKTQMFTERYMVEWLLHNSLGLTWLSICKKNGWTADAEAVLPVLDARRAAWRTRREAGEVALDALMPIEGALENAWKYYVPQPVPEDAVASAPTSIREVKLLDPACGSGHFLVIAFGLFAMMYEEEARHRGQAWSAEEIAGSILANNLHGIDIDPRAIQIAAAGLWLRAKLHARGAKLGRMNLVAPAFRLAALPKDDPALATLVKELAALGIPAETTASLVQCLSGVDHLGTLLRVDRAIGDMVAEAAAEVGTLFAHAAGKQRAALEARVGAFLDAHAAESDLGLRLEGEQLAAGLRFIEIAKEGRYDVVVGNPPYQGISKTAQFEYVVKRYEEGKADLYAAFLQRSLELVREGGLSALLTMRGWMFLGQFKELREHVLSEFAIRTIGDFDRGAFDEVPNEVLAVSAPVIARARNVGARSVGMQPTPFDDKSYDRQRTNRKRAAVLAGVGRYEFDPKSFKVIDGAPIVYWWANEFFERYESAPKLGSVAPIRLGVRTSDNTRFLRNPWEVTQGPWDAYLATARAALPDAKWAPYIKGAEGREWLEPLNCVFRWDRAGLEVKLKLEQAYGMSTQSPEFYFVPGVAFSMIGAGFRSRAHRFRSIIGDKGSSAFPSDIPQVLAVMNRASSRAVVESINPSISFQVGDVARIPFWKVANADIIFERLEQVFSAHEAQREPSVEFKRPGDTTWVSAQSWAQAAVDRAPGESVPDFAASREPLDSTASVSYAVGVALGRFGDNGDGVLLSSPSDALPAGILFIGPADTLPDSLAHPAAARILDAWTDHGSAILNGKKQSLREYLRKDFFAYHKNLYENRPIYFPLSSDKRSFVAWISIHRWTDRTLQTLLADHLNPVLRQLDGEIKDLNATRASSDKKTAVQAEKQYGTVKRLRDELADFIARVTELAERGAAPTDASCPPRAADAPFVMDLDDGVMINSAALWPLLAPQWSDPKKWWKQLCVAEGKKDYDWAHLTRRYFPARVDAKCQVDPSLGVAHGCFWKYHPAKAFAWELRLQDEIRPDFTIDEEGSNEARARFLADHALDASALRDKELLRRDRKAAKAAVEVDDAPAGDPPDDAEVEGAETAV